MDTLGSSWHRQADDVQGPDETEASASDAAGSMGKTSPMPSSTTARSTLFLRPVSGQAENLNAGSGARSAAELETETVGLQTGAERPNPARSAKPTQASDSSTTVPAAVLTGSMPAPWSAPVNTTPPVETGAATVRLEMDSKTAMESSDTRQPASGRSTDKAESNGSERANPARSAKPTQTSDSLTTASAAVLTGSLPAPGAAPVNTPPPVETASRRAGEREASWVRADGLAGNPAGDALSQGTQAPDSSASWAETAKQANPSPALSQETEAPANRAPQTFVHAPLSVFQERVAALNDPGPSSPTRAQFAAATEPGGSNGSAPPQTENSFTAPTGNESSVSAQSLSAATAASPSLTSSQRAATTHTGGEAASAAGVSFRATAAERKKPEMSRSATASTTEGGARTVSMAGEAQHRSPLVAFRPAGASVDATALARGQADARQTTNTVSGASGGVAGSSLASAVHDPFAALDADSSPPTPSWIHAGTRQAEAGYQDPTLGWVGVRAEVDAGGIHASLVPGSADAAQALSGHLAGLNSYLAEQHMPVAALTVAAFADGESSDAGAGQNMQQQAGQNSGQGAPVETPAGARPDASAPGPAETAATRALGGLIEVSNPGSRYVSVMA